MRRRTRVMKLALNFEILDLMKRASRPVQGLEPHSGMSTRSIRSAKNDRRWPIPNLHLFSKDLKNTSNFVFHRECSSAGEHMTEDHGVGGSTPPIPILKVLPKEGTRTSSRHPKGFLKG